MRFVAASFLSIFMLGCGCGVPVTPTQRLARATNELANAATTEKRFYALDGAAKESFVAGKTEDARKYADELMTMLPKFQGNWNYGNAVQDANLVLGRIAATEGRMEDAKRYLLAAGKSPGSPQMMQVLERGIQQCYNTYQVHYQVRISTAQSGELVTVKDAYFFTEPELIAYPEPEKTPDDSEALA